MKNLIIAALLLASSTVFAHGSSHPKKEDPPPPPEVVATGKPCWIQVNDEPTYMNAKLITQISKTRVWNKKTSEYDLPAVFYQAGKQTAVAATPNPEAVMKDFMAQTDKCK
jgi:hypothetical protein